MFQKNIKAFLAKKRGNDNGTAMGVSAAQISRQRIGARAERLTNCWYVALFAAVTVIEPPAEAAGRSFTTAATPPAAAAAAAAEAASLRAAAASPRKTMD